jgi:hypothetical protein
MFTVRVIGSHIIPSKYPGLDDLDRARTDLGSGVITLKPPLEIYFDYNNPIIIQVNEHFARRSRLFFNEGQVDVDIDTLARAKSFFFIRTLPIHENGSYETEWAFDEEVFLQEWEELGFPNIF